jgi:hypothetical protein
MGRTIAEISEETLKLETYIGTKKDGDELSFFQIETETKIKMNERGKNFLRTALKRAKREYSSIHGHGIKLANASLVVPILSHKFKKIDRAVHRADKSHRNLQEQFFDQLDPVHQKQVLFAGAVFGAIRIAAQNGKLIYKKETKNANDNGIKIQIPKIDF